MHEMDRQIEAIKWERRVGTVNYYLLLAQAAAGLGAAASSIPLSILNEIPRWAQIAMAGGGSYFAIAGIYCAKDIKPLLNRVREEEIAIRKRVASLKEER